MIETLIVSGFSAVVMFILFFLVPTDRTGKRNQQMKTSRSIWEPLTNELRAINFMLLLYLVGGIIMFTRTEYLLLKILELLEK